MLLQLWRFAPLCGKGTYNQTVRFEVLLAHPLWLRQPRPQDTVVIRLSGNFEWQEILRVCGGYLKKISIQVVGDPKWLVGCFFSLKLKAANSIGWYNIPR